MSHQPRPPEAKIAAMVSQLLPIQDVTTKQMDDVIRRELTDTAYRFPRIAELVKSYRRLVAEGAVQNLALERLLRCKTVRTDSGVAPITLLTKPYACPGKCVYCPTEARMPKSYVASEPAAARALHLKFDPYTQVYQRVQSLEKNGHEAKKIELIVKGGTWSAYPWDYRQWFIKRCFDAANHLGQAKKTRYGSLAASQKANESAEYRVIGLTIETRPDWISPKEIGRLRELGVTRVELGVQALDDAILDLTQRGHSVLHAVRATVLLKAAAFKTDYHFLPGQPGSNPGKDVEMFKQMFEDSRFCPDMVKLYPCVVLPSAELAQWHKEGRYQPLEGEQLVEMLIEMQRHVPRYCRISRLIRDFPSQEISAGNKVTNLRQTIEERMKARGYACVCLRCREVGHQDIKDLDLTPTLFVDSYQNVGGTEYFISFEDPKRQAVFSFLRLRIPDTEAVTYDEKTQTQLDEVKVMFPELKGCAFVRELHTYGQALSLKQQNQNVTQHKGLGQKMMQAAERLAKQHGLSAIAVISGIGVRAYYEMLGYQLAGTYMKKELG